MKLVVVRNAAYMRLAVQTDNETLYLDDDSTMQVDILDPDLGDYPKAGRWEALPAVNLHIWKVPVVDI